MRRGGGTRVAGLIGAMVLALFMVVMDNSILNVALPYLSSPEGGLGAGVDELQWVINAYVLSFGAFIFVWAVIGGRLGQRRAILAATALFGVFSMLAGLSTSPLVLIILRALMGVAAAGMQPTSLSIINTGVPESLRARAIGLWSAAAGLAVVSGPIFGGLLLEHLGWRSIFFINVPLSCLLLALTIVFVPRSLDAESPRASVRSVVLLMAGMFLLVYGITEWGDNPDQLVLPALLVGVGVLLCLVFFLLQEMSASPVMPVSMVFGKRTAGASVSLALAMMLLMGNVFVMMLYLRLVRGYDALTVAYTLLPVGIAQLLISPVASSSIKRIHPRVTVLVGFALTALAFLGYSRFDERTAMWLILVVFFVHGAGAALVVPVATATFIVGVPERMSASASGVNTAIRQLSTALGVAVFGAVLSPLYTDRLRASGVLGAVDAPAGSDASITATLQAASRLDPGQALRLVQQAERAFVGAMQVSFLVGLALACVGLVVSVAIPRGRAKSEARGGGGAPGGRHAAPAAHGRTAPALRAARRRHAVPAAYGRAAPAPRADRRRHAAPAAYGRMSS